MIIIADSGSTKTDWVLIGDKGCVPAKTQGINPMHQNESAIRHILCDEFKKNNVDACNALIDAKEKITEIYFYGAGCTDAVKPKMERIVRNIYPDASIEVQGDMMAAARATLGHESGIACILGTGSNSCYYDGRNIRSNIHPLGYILGDEGSGSVMGRKFMNLILKGDQYRDLREMYFNRTGLTYEDIIERVYRQPLANRFLASTAIFIAQHIEIPVLEHLVCNSFDEFFKRNVSLYSDITTEKDVSFVGGIASSFSHLLEEKAQENGFTVRKIMERPMNGLIAYHAPEANISI